MLILGMYVRNRFYWKPPWKVAFLCLIKIKTAKKKLVAKTFKACNLVKYKMAAILICPYVFSCDRNWWQWKADSGHNNKQARQQHKKDNRVPGCSIASEDIGNLQDLNTICDPLRSKKLGHKNLHHLSELNL